MGWVWKVSFRYLVYGQLLYINMRDSRFPFSFISYVIFLLFAFCFLLFVQGVLIIYTLDDYYFLKYRNFDRCTSYY